MKELTSLRLVFSALLAGAIVALLASSNQPTGTTGTQELPNASQTQLSDNAHSSDSETLKTAIQSDMQRDPRLAHVNIAVNVTSTEIQLSGIAPDAGSKLVAMRLAWSRAGGRPVEGDGIKISSNRVQPNPGPGAFH